MSSKTDILYAEILRRRVMRFDDIVASARDLFGRSYNGSYIYSKYLRRLLESGRLERVRRGLYVALSPVEDEPSVDKLLVASKVRPEYYLGYHTALEFYGCAYSAHDEVYVCVKPDGLFSPFDFTGLRYRPVYVEDVDSEVEEKIYRGHTIRVSGREKTFVDCLDRVEYGGGWEETVKSLQNLGGLDFEKVERLTIRAENDMLLRRVGFMLELLKETSVFYEHLPEEILDQLGERVSNQYRYLRRGVPGPLNTRWRLYIPDGFEDELRSV